MYNKKFVKTRWTPTSIELPIPTLKRRAFGEIEEILLAFEYTLQTFRRVESRLSESQRMLLQWHAQGLSAAAIAELTKAPERTVRAEWYRLLLHLYDELLSELRSAPPSTCEIFASSLRDPKTFLDFVFVAANPQLFVQLLISLRN